MAVTKIVLDGVPIIRRFVIDGLPVFRHILTQFLRNAETGRHLHSFHTGKTAKLGYVTCRQLLAGRFVIKRAIVCSGSPDGEANPIRQVCHSADDVIMDDIHRCADNDHQQRHQQCRSNLPTRTNTQLPPCYQIRRTEGLLRTDTPQSAQHFCVPHDRHGHHLTGTAERKPAGQQNDQHGQRQHRQQQPPRRAEQEQRRGNLLQRPRCTAACQHRQR